MVEDKKVFIIKVDTMENVENSLKTIVRSYPITPCRKRKQQVGECWVCVIFFEKSIPCTIH
jgi:hypothetical protein